MPILRKYASNADRQAAYRARCVSIVGTPSRPGYRRWDVMLRQALTLLEPITLEMDDYYEERSESWQESERGDTFTERSELIKEATDLLRDLP